MYSPIKKAAPKDRRVKNQIGCDALPARDVRMPPHPRGRQLVFNLVGEFAREPPALAGMIAGPEHYEYFIIDNGYGTDHSNRHAAVSRRGQIGSPCASCSQCGPAFIRVE